MPRAACRDLISFGFARSGFGAETSVKGAAGMFGFDEWRTGLSPVLPDSITLQHNELRTILLACDNGLVGWLGFPAVTIDYAVPKRLTGTTGYTTRKMLALIAPGGDGVVFQTLEAFILFRPFDRAFCLLFATFALLILAAGKTV
jgi:hypothetical protein